MSGYRPIKQGSRVRHTGTGARGVVQELVNGGQALVRFPTGTTRVSMALLARGRGGPGRKKQVAREVPDLQVRPAFREVIRARLRELSMTRAVLVQRAHISRSMLERVLTQESQGTFQVRTIEAIAAALGISPSAFWVEVPSNVQPALP